MKSALEEHTQWITDVRFSPSMSRVATSSADKTVRVWEVDNVTNAVFVFFFQPESVIIYLFILILIKKVFASS